ncbi:hypothetical protein OG909_03160 [Streptomyces sp. NBC_01754]|uniref:hypothetical protein n=1 Tax=Streptomyces sp. NBC_01754 TaxID=2975930 RepID=UPI002DD9A581|nr:hypothetical protein [Streptomyces sp. NBC_01754]WSC91375.1 hypothetical protein OG909_03160 [Streptomyces sp. NBC_01754]
MTHTQHHRTRRNGRRTTRARQRSGPSPRRALRRETPSTVGLLVDAEDFAAMRDYGSFTFDDHSTYLRQVEALLRTLAAQGTHTTVALFDPLDYAEFCAEADLDPDRPASRSRYTAEAAATGATVAYTGQPVGTLIPLLVSRAVRRATWEYATMLLTGLGHCADCGQDIGRAAFDRASHLLARLLEAAGPGTHHVVCSTPTKDEQLIAVLHTTGGTEGGPAQLEPSEGAEFATVLAVGVALESKGGVVLRTTAPGAADRVHGWRLSRGSLVPLTAGEVFAAYCTDADTGEPVSPEPDVEYCAGFDLGADEPEAHH